jgi:hypothetical protein
MAGPSFLRGLASRELDKAVVALADILGDDPEVVEVLTVVQRDVVGKSDPEFRVSVLVGTLSRALLAQQERIERLEARLGIGDEEPAADKSKAKLPSKRRKAS